MLNTMIKSCMVLVAFNAVVLLAAPSISEPQFGRPSAPDESNLEFLFAKVLKKQETAKTHKLLSFIGQAVPYGIDASIPFMGEYETFRSDKSANFVNDGQGHVVFRQFRRARLSDILHNVNRRAGGV